MRKYLLFVCTLLITGLIGQVSAQTQVTGQITDAADGTPLPGVSIVQKGTTVGTTSGIDGNYTINVPANATLVFSFVGYASQEVPVNGQSSISIQLGEDIASSRKLW